ncbi:class I SAM-dependent methyltransferase [Desulfuromonas sp. AOP6]|uniref:class I SAM-dependent methyltransferase n=1 Tax=Desulfuromonas sp. AOP6 TaxID=1566351 RepID=UPI0012842CB2|nr:class I SAM-dependent methyltransferase [Desulfuromonas sp. AOP6]BCA79485.1 NDP-hexose methyltransferase [Desulfuromonas sp. AOP6]
MLIGVLWENREEALACPKGDLKLAFCPDCGFICNNRFEPDRLQYSQAYDNSLHFSPVYQEYAEATVLNLVERYGIRNKTVIEIGCGKGDFLMLLCRLGQNRGIGFDQSYEERTLPAEIHSQISFVKDFYGPDYASYQADLICSRYVLEHIPNPLGFLGMLRQIIADPGQTLLYCEVPNVGLILNQHSVWDIIYEHYAYFSLGSLARLFEQAGFQVIQGRESFSGQFASLEARVGQGQPRWNFDHASEIAELASAVDSFENHFKSMVARWREVLQAAASNNQRVVLWGGGAKGVSFLNMLGVGSEIDYVVDINPGKQGRYIAGTGQQIASPQFLKKYAPQTVIVLNPAYRGEIQAMLVDLGLTPEVLCV